MVIDRADFDTAGDVLPRPHGNTYWLLAGRVLAGEHPDPGHPDALALRLQAFQAVKVTCFIDLTGSESRDAYQPLPVGGRAARREPHGIVDFGVPTVAGMRRVLDAVAAALAADEVVYLHCRAGVGRTGTVAGCLLVEHGFAPDEALALLQRKFQAMSKRAFFARTPETEAQRAFIATWRSGLRSA